ncbi:hypothetical protein DAPPUDRAFT_102309 [Daphnia pulex]|uniref:Uncharacterized protein n=1 Tax=Daphnia pulex TaxID=6669 RepID=E9GG14_DAPPU|nr:hypothetical protein DAPPUDRAFT_102309 [Daphnia pulex]|eukprot:EFX81322.1 hypothetical protein DAPPUDRAFT_102309 [Daphnia pulex]
MVVAMENAASEIKAAATSLDRAAAFIRVAFSPYVRVPLVPTRPIARQPLSLPSQQQDPVAPLEALTTMVEAMKINCQYTNDKCGSEVGKCILYAMAARQDLEDIPLVNPKRAGTKMQAANEIDRVANTSVDVL